VIPALLSLLALGTGAGGLAVAAADHRSTPNPTSIATSVPPEAVGRDRSPAAGRHDHARGRHGDHGDVRGGEDTEREAAEHEQTS
jgi:hypothetical protein